MSQLIIVTTPQNSGLGTPLATAFDYTNSNFGELYARYQTNPPSSAKGRTGDVAGMYSTDSTYFYYCYANYDGVHNIWAQVTQVGNISVSSIQNGNSNITIGGSGSNILVGVGGTANVAVFSTNRVKITGNLSVTGNVTGSYILGDGSQLVNLPVLYGDANVAALLSTFGGNNISTTGTITSGNILVGNVQTNGQVSAAGNVIGNYILGNGSQLTGLPATYTNSNVVSLLSSFGSNSISTTGNVTANYLVSPGAVIGSGISTTGNVISQGVVSAVGNIVTNGYFVGTFVGNVTGNFVVPGSNTQVIFNTNGNADAVGGMTYNKGSNTFTVLGIVSSQGNVIAGNVVTAGQISATGNVTGGNLTASANVTGGNILTAGLVTATGSINTSSTISATGNIRGGNILSNGIISSSANVSGNNFIGTGVSVTGTITAASTVGGVISGASVSVTGNVSAGNLIGTIATANQPTITSLGTLTSLSVAGNIQTGNINTVGQISATGNISGNNLAITNVNAGGTIVATTLDSANASVSGNVIGGNVLTGGQVSAVGNITGNFILGNVALASGLPGNYGDSNVITLLSAFGNNSISTTGNITANSFIVTGTVVNNGISTTGNVIANYYLGSALSVSGNVTAASVIGTIATANQSAITTVGTLASLSVTGNITGGNLSVGSGTITVGNIVSGAGNLLGTIGNATTWFGNAYVKAVNALYADLAENYTADAEYAPGTVVIFGGINEITTTTEFADERVAGVVSTNPAYLMNSSQPGTAVALRGRVPVRVIGPVTKGDSLVTSARSGLAESVGRSRDYAQAVFAKALETVTDNNEHVITAVIL